jgi:hypothetical protein
MRDTSMATEADLKRLKHKEDCPKLKVGKFCNECFAFGYDYWKCVECGVVGYTDGIESHTCPGFKN